MATEPGPLPVLYADDVVLVVDKPAGLLSVPGRGEDKQDCLSARVQCHYPDALVVHRLDMATSGLLLMARGKAAQKTLSMAFANRQVDKTYVALVHGQVHAAPGDWHEIDLPIAVDWPRRPRRIIQADGGKPSLTRWRLLHHAGTSASRIELVPMTGRSHQLRVHMRAIGHPIVGDALYAEGYGQPTPARLMLHATSIAFQHPGSSQAMHFSSAPGF